MTRAGGHSLSRWKYRHAKVLVLGIALNLAYCVPLLVAPNWTLALFGIPLEHPDFWPRLVGGLLILISVFYVPAIVDIDRYRLVAWLSILPSRTFGTIFLLAAVLVFGYSSGFLVPAAIDGGIAIASLYCLIRVVELEQGLATGRVTS